MERCQYCSKPARFAVFDVDGRRELVCGKHIVVARASFNQMPGATHVVPFHEAVEEPQEQDDGEF